MSIVDKNKVRIAMSLAIFFAFLFLFDFIIIALYYSYSDWIAILIFSLLLIFPAYISNASMVILGGGKPIDGGKKWRDGRRIFGDHKTWSGLLKGPLYMGIPISIGIFLLFLTLWPFILPIITAANSSGEYKIYTSIATFEYYFIGGVFPLGILVLIIRITLCSFGAGIGDLIGSFCKRRLNIPSGAPFWIVDQTDHAIGAIIFLIIPVFFLPSMFWFPDIFIITFLLILTPSVSIIANTVAYLLGLKEVPW